MNRTEYVVVTGASAGIGRAVAHAFAARGAHIGLLARNEERLEIVKKEVEGLHGSAIVLPADVANPVEVEKVAEQFAASSGGRIDVWVNCAMATVYGEFLDSDPLDFKRVTEVTYLGYVYGTQAALKRMVRTDSGTIVQVGSILAYRSIPLQSAYCGAKHAIRGFTDSIRSELMHNRKKIWITSVHLPAVNTPQFSWCRNRMGHMAQPVPPTYEPEVAAEAIVWAAHHRRREVILGGRSSLIIWANKLLPGLGDIYTARFSWDAQQRPEEVDPEKPDNLYSTVDGPFGVRGEFSKGSRTRSIHLQLVKLAAYPYMGMVLFASWLVWLVSKLARCTSSERI